MRCMKWVIVVKGGYVVEALLYTISTSARSGLRGHQLPGIMTPKVDIQIR